MITTRAPDGANKFVLHWVKSTWYSVIEELRMTDSRIFFSNLGWTLHPRESEDLIMKVAATWLPAWLARWPGDPQIMDAPDSAQYHTPASGASDKFFIRFFAFYPLDASGKVLGNIWHPWPPPSLLLLIRFPHLVDLPDLEESRNFQWIFAEKTKNEGGLRIIRQQDQRADR